MAHPYMASTMTGEFVKASSRVKDSPFSMIEQKGLFARLTDELALATREVARDPRGFIRDLFSADSRDARRRRLIYTALSCAVLVHIALFIVMIVLGWPQALTPAEQERAYKIEMVRPIDKDTEQVDSSQPAEQPRGDNGGGGGGGQQSPLPASHGAPPQMLSVPPQVALTQPTVEKPLLPITPSIVGPDSPPPPPDVPLGDPNAKSETVSAGTGKGGGIGSGTGQGVGPGEGGGTGPGSGGDTGKGRPAGSPEGTGSPTEIIWSTSGPKPPGFTSFSWVYRPTPMVTPEAQANRVVGTVLLRATFQADGRITDIETVNPVSFMTESAVDALRRSKFRPATINGQPVTLRRVLVRIDVHY